MEFIDGRGTKHIEDQCELMMTGISEGHIMHLLVLSREQGLPAQHLCEDTTDRPDVDGLG